MLKYSVKKGITVTEMLVVCVITGVLMLSTVYMTNNAFIGQDEYNKNINARQQKNFISERISSQVKEAAKVYYSPLYLFVPLGNYNYYVMPERNSLAVLIPKFDSTGTLVQPSAGVTTFTGVAFSILPKYLIDYNSHDYSNYVVLETTAEFNLATSQSDPLAITGILPTNWGIPGSKSNILAENLKPGNFTNLGHNAFALSLENDNTTVKYVNFAFVPQGDDIYFPSSYGNENIDDSEYLTRCQFRNYRT